MLSLCRGSSRLSVDLCRAIYSASSSRAITFQLPATTRSCRVSSAGACIARAMATTEGMHRAVRILKPGGVDCMSYDLVPKPVPGAGEVLVHNAFAGVNFIDTYHRSGLYPVDLPFVLGVEGSGTVVSLGEPAAGAGQHDIKAGDRVAYFGRVGSYAEYSAVPLSKVVKLPAEVGMDQAAAVLLQGMTALSLITKSYAVQPGDFVLVHAAAGGTGQLLTQLCSQMGATVIGTTSTEAKAAVAKKAGAAHVVLYTQQDTVQEVMRITGGAGVRAVYDGVGKDTFDTSLKCCGLGATLASFGNASGKVPPIDIAVLSPNNIRLMRPTLFEYTKTAEEFQELAQAVLSHMVTGGLKPAIQKVFPLQEAAQAHACMEARGTVGKLLLQM